MISKKLILGKTNNYLFIRKNKFTPLSLSIKPFKCSFVIVKERLNLVVALLVVLFDPRFLFFREHAFYNHPRLYRNASQSHKAETTLRIGIHLKGLAPHHLTV